MTIDDVGQLVSAAQTGDQAAYVALVRRHYQPVFLTCLGVLGHQQDAEDMTQEAFVKGCQQLAQLRDQAQFGAWIARIARNISINLLRKRKVAKQHMETTKLQNEGPSSSHTIDVEQAVARLPEDLRLPLVLFYFNGHNVKQVAVQLEMSASNVYQRLRQALKQLHVLLAESGDVS